MSKKKFAEPWKEFASRWQKYYTPPGRPSRAAIKVYKDYTRKAIKGIKNPKVLVLGSTPELRDLPHELKAEVTLIDINLEMILAIPIWICRVKKKSRLFNFTFFKKHVILP